MVLCLGEPLRRFLFCCCIFICQCFSFCCCSFHCFSTSSLTLPWTIARFLHPFYTLSSAYHRVICNTFIFNHPVFFLLRVVRFWVSIFYPQALFTLPSFTDILPAFIKASLGAGSSFLTLAGLHTDPQNTGPVHPLVWFTVVHSLHIQNDSVLNSTIY